MTALPRGGRRYVTWLSPHQALELKTVLKAEREKSQGLQETVTELG